ncbi:MAG: hypothetical protein WD398_00775 [Cyclobacteriaceae bacterium]
MTEFKELVALISNAELFEKIHLAKAIFTEIFSRIANGLPKDQLKELHQPFKGIKISKGNELERCPYQVLDLIRDFNPNSGLNFRILHWWGRGIFIFVFFGKDHPAVAKALPLFEFAIQKNFNFCACRSPWDYPFIIDLKNYYKPQSVRQIHLHLNQFGHLQMMKSMPYESPDSLANSLYNEIQTLCHLLKKD